jgi:hypothetical protein
MSARSPLTAALRQRSRRPARHAVCPFEVFLRQHFFGYRNSASTKNSLKAEQAGAFFSSESAEKKRTGRVGLSVT